MKKNPVRGRLFTFSLLMAGVFSGCGDPTGGVVTVPVAGTVVMDGQPLETGSLTFNPVDGQGATAGAVIQDGKFSARVPPGSKLVQISSSKVVGQRKAYDDPNDQQMIDIVEDQVAPEFNVSSALKCEIPEKGISTLAFEVKRAKSKSH